jgi:hypothetical protein
VKAWGKKKYLSWVTNLLKLLKITDYRDFSIDYLYLFVIFPQPFSFCLNPVQFKKQGSSLPPLSVRPSPPSKCVWRGCAERKERLRELSLCSTSQGRVCLEGTCYLHLVCKVPRNGKQPSPKKDQSSNNKYRSTSSTCPILVINIKMNWKQMFLKEFWSRLPHKSNNFYFPSPKFLLLSDFVSMLWLSHRIKHS